MPNERDVPFRPLVTSATTAQSLNIKSVMDSMNQGVYVIPDYQRDSSQWDTAKKSLFIESIINNLTVPPLIVYPEDTEEGLETRQVIDGQQRLTTIREYLDGKFALSTEEDVEYAENVGALIQGKRFSELPPRIQRQIEYYTINLIVLPKNLELSLRLEIFRRINEGGVPLSGHDLRLATFGESERVWLIRLAGVFNPQREGAKRIIEAAKKRYDLAYPWSDHKVWRKWWGESRQSIGQAPSEMYLYYTIARDLGGVNTVLESPKTQNNLGIRYDKTTASVLDLYCAQLQREDSHPSNTLQALAPMTKMQAWFADFEAWFSEILKGMRVPLHSSRKLAFFIAAAAMSDLWSSPKEVTPEQWDRIQVFLHEGPHKIETRLGFKYPIVKGKWPKQREQIERTRDVLPLLAKVD